jgi:hypothetical protein
MQTKYNIGDQILVPGTIEGISEENGKTVYNVNAAWKIPEEAILIDKNGEQSAKLDYYKQLRDSLFNDSFARY